MVAVKENYRTKKRAKTLGNRYWRLNHLYYIMTEQGEKILFEMKNRPVLEKLYYALWWLNVIPKSRQHGITTFIALFMLDACLFNSNVRCGLIAHKLADAKKIFRDKIRYAYENLPADLKEARRLIKDDALEIMFSNNSGIYVATSMRSGTLQYLHVSEYGWICTHAASKAAEIKSGATGTVHKGGMIFVESTFEGPNGDFPDMCKDAALLQAKDKKIGPMDYKLHFFGWMDKPENITDPSFVEITTEDHIYFDKIEKALNKKLSLPQRAWYVAKKKSLKYLMTKEQPSTLEEARIASVEGAYLISDMSQMREEGRICRVPHLPAFPVHTVCDLGSTSGHMPWIFFQVVGLEYHIIDCFNLGEKEDIRAGATFYKRMLDVKREKYRYGYGKHFCPFDIDKGEIGTGKIIFETFQQHGITFVVLDRETNIIDGIQRLINIMPSIYIDAEKCDELITAWLCYHREWIENLGRYDERPHDDKSSHYADAGRYLSEVIAKKLYVMEERREPTQLVAEMDYAALG